jgi:hypothetical protein
MYVQSTTDKLILMGCRSKENRREKEVWSVGQYLFTFRVNEKCQSKIHQSLEEQSRDFCRTYKLNVFAQIVAD